MPAYTQLKVAELRQLCDERQIDANGLTKPQLIAALRASDGSDDDGRTNERGGEQGLDNGDDRESSDGDSVTEYSSVADQVGDEPETVAILKLKLVLAERQAKWERERDEREKERDQRASEARERQWEIEREKIALMAQTQVSPTTPGVNRATNRADIQHLLPKMSGGDDDILNFFHTFERAMQLNRVQKCDWPRYLPAQLNSKANKVLSALTLEQNEDYDTCKRSVLDYYQLGAQSYLKAFRTLRRSNGETFKMYKNRLKEFFRYFMDARDIVELDQLADSMLCEQFLESIPPEVKQFVVSKQPLDSDQCSEYADLFSEMTRTTNKVGQGARNAATPEPAQTQARGNNGGNKNPYNWNNSKQSQRRPTCWGVWSH